MGQGRGLSNVSIFNNVGSAPSGIRRRARNVRPWPTGTAARPDFGPGPREWQPAAVLARGGEALNRLVAGPIALVGLWPRRGAVLTAASRGRLGPCGPFPRSRRPFVPLNEESLV